jgi:hypothetical protein
VSGRCNIAAPSPTVTIVFYRYFLLGMAALAFLTATVLDGFMMRHVLAPLLRVVAARSPTPPRYPPPMRFMLERAWARRLYHLAFGVLLLFLWWYLGTPSGAALLLGRHAGN